MKIDAATNGSSATATDGQGDRFGKAAAMRAGFVAASGEIYTGELLLADRYAIRSVLSRSSFSEISIARNIRLPGQAHCIVKKLSPKSTDPEQIEIARHQFALEALSLSRLGSHSQIPSLLDYFDLDGNSYLVQEYILGQTLSQIVSQGQVFTPIEVEKFLLQMLRLLEYIHAHNTIHRDLKPENIIRAQTDGRYVLLDFGAVKEVNPADTHTTIYTHSIGTLGFAPPEQLANRTVYASDLYALGMTCIYLLTGKEPNQLPIDPYTCTLKWADEIEIDRDLYETIEKMVQVSISSRYHSATQVLTAMENRSIRATLRAYLDRKHAVSKTECIGDSFYYPAAVYRALGSNFDR